MTDYLRLKGFDEIFETTLNNELQDNVIEFLDWGLLEKGNYFNVHLNESSPNGQDYSLLRLSSSDHYEKGKAWEGFRKIGYGKAELIITHSQLLEVITLFLVFPAYM